MKTLLVLLLVVPALSFGQQIVTGGSVGSGHVFDQTMLYTKSNFTTALLDTTTWYNIEPTQSYGIIIQSTDSAVLDIYCDARNSALPNTNAYTTYADSLTLADSVAGGDNSGERRNVLLKTTTLNRLNGPTNNQVRFRIDHRASNAGTTSGRLLRVWFVKTN